MSLAREEISGLDNGPSRLAKVSAAVAYCLTSTLLTVLNKYVLTVSEGGFSHVNFLICVQQFFIFTSIFVGHLLSIVKLKYAPSGDNPCFDCVLTFLLYVTSSAWVTIHQLATFTVLRKLSSFHCHGRVASSVQDPTRQRNMVCSADTYRASYSIQRFGV